MKMFGIANCDTIKKARKFLESNQIEYQFHDFRKDGIDDQRLEKWLKLTTLDKLTNKRSTSWRGLSDEQKAIFSNTQDITHAIPILIEQPTLIKRPVLEMDDQLIIGFKESDYQQLISNSFKVTSQISD